MAKLLKRAIEKIDNEKIQSIAWVAVRYAEKKFKDLNGKDKFDKAYAYVANKIPGVEQEDVEKAIEAAVKSMDAELGNAVSSPTAS